jgi:hypothetical protein
MKKVSLENIINKETVLITYTLTSLQTSAAEAHSRKVIFATRSDTEHRKSMIYDMAKLGQFHHLYTQNADVRT